jgi:hypothetical protein
VESPTSPFGDMSVQEAENSFERLRAVQRFTKAAGQPRSWDGRQPAAMQPCHFAVSALRAR